MDYGIANKRGKISKKEAFGILKFLSDVSIDALDTAFFYGDSERTIGDFIAENRINFKIISKPPEFDEYGPEDAEGALSTSLTNLKQKRIYAYLIHRFDDFVKYDRFWHDLKDMRRRGLVEKIGFSVYKPQDVDTLLAEEIDFDIIQVPYSIFDRRFENYFSVLKKHRIEICARSVFLQGLAFLNLDELEKGLEGARGHLEALEQIATESGISKNAICLNFALLNPLIDRVVIGVDRLNHLKENIENIASLEKVKGICDRLEELQIEDEDILLPYKWSKK